MLTVPFALVGGFWFIWLLGHAVSVATAVGFIALAGLAAEFGVVMLVYLRNSLNQRLDAGTPVDQGTDCGGDTRRRGACVSALKQ